MDHAELNQEESASLLRQAEGHFLDFKSRRISPAKASQTLSAFANADGGELIVGIEDVRAAGGRWIGFDDEEAANAHVALLHQLFPLGETFSYTFITSAHHTGILLKVEALKNRAVWADSAGDHFARRGAQNIRLSRDEIRQIEYSKGLISFEDQKLEVGEDYLDDSEALSNFIKNIIPTANSGR